jgi:hypothetical protein
MQCDLANARFFRGIFLYFIYTPSKIDWPLPETNRP